MNAHACHAKETCRNMNTKQGKLPNKPGAAAIATDRIGTGVMHLAVLL